MVRLCMREGREREREIHCKLVSQSVVAIVASCTVDGKVILLCHLVYVFLGMNIIETNCTVSHLPVSLCCKSGEEYLQYYRETLNNTKNPKSYK